MDATRGQAVNVEAGKAFGSGPMNTFSTSWHSLRRISAMLCGRTSTRCTRSLGWTSRKNRWWSRFRTRKAAATCSRCSICGRTCLPALASARRAPAQVVSRLCRPVGRAGGLSTRRRPMSGLSGARRPTAKRTTGPSIRCKLATPRRHCHSWARLSSRSGQRSTRPWT